MIHSSNITEFKAHLESLKNAKENAVIALEKKVANKVVQAKNSEYAAIVKEVYTQESLRSQIDKSYKYVNLLQRNTDLQEQQVDKKINLDIAKAEKLIDGLSIKENELFPATNLQHDKVKNDEEQAEVLKILNAQRTFKDLHYQKEKQDEKIRDYIAEEQTLLNALQKELIEQKRKQELLKKKHIQIGLLHKLENQIEAKKEIQNLRIEDECWSKLEEDKRKEADNCAKSLATEKSLKEERELQIRSKKDMEASQKTLDEEYLRLLMALQAEEERLEDLRAQIRRRKENQHRVVAQQILEERRKRRKHFMQKLKDENQKEEEFSNLRDKMFEEEEKRLLLTYLPHLGPYLTPTVLSKLSSL